MLFLWIEWVEVFYMVWMMCRFFLSVLICCVVVSLGFLMVVMVLVKFFVLRLSLMCLLVSRLRVVVLWVSIIGGCSGRLVMLGVIVMCLVWVVMIDSSVYVLRNFVW